MNMMSEVGFQPTPLFGDQKLSLGSTLCVKPSVADPDLQIRGVGGGGRSSLDPPLVLVSLIKCTPIELVCLW